MGSQMQRRLQRRCHRDVDDRSPAVDAEMEHAEQHDRVVAFAVGAAKRVMDERRCRLADVQERHLRRDASPLRSATTARRQR